MPFKFVSFIYQEERNLDKRKLVERNPLPSTQNLFFWAPFVYLLKKSFFANICDVSKKKTDLLRVNRLMY